MRRRRKKAAAAAGGNQSRPAGSRPHLDAGGTLGAAGGLCDPGGAKIFTLLHPAAATSAFARLDFNLGGEPAGATVNEWWTCSDFATLARAGIVPAVVRVVAGDSYCIPHAMAHEVRNVGGGGLKALGMEDLTLSIAWDFYVKPRECDAAREVGRQNALGARLLEAHQHWLQLSDAEVVALQAEKEKKENNNKRPRLSLSAKRKGKAYEAYLAKLYCFDKHETL